MKQTSLGDRLILVDEYGFPLGKSGNGFCKNCFKFFTKSTLNQKYCSYKCGDRYNARKLYYKNRIKKATIN